MFLKDCKKLRLNDVGTGWGKYDFTIMFSFFFNYQYVKELQI